MLNFAYGSNMLLARIRQRVPTARLLHVAVLDRHVLRWTKAGMDGSAKCTIEPAGHPGARVHGVVYEIDPAEKPALDRAEGLGNGYEEVAVEVVRSSGSAAERTVRALAYRATRVDPDLLPFSWYHALVVAGARQHRLPPDYIGTLLAVRARRDPDPARHARSMALLNALIRPPP